MQRELQRRHDNGSLFNLPFVLLRRLPSQKKDFFELFALFFRSRFFRAPCLILPPRMDGIFCSAIAASRDCPRFQYGGVSRGHVGGSMFWLCLSHHTMGCLWDSLLTLGPP